ncbi:raftlin-like [Hypanus sabinus]|uniref:raftlin-like n=1 Tax=Hypanus sabinus TaxID=79690 RepID=UPI0028C450BC|nr:raftlin-like [Hypanus sabinus]
MGCGLPKLEKSDENSPGKIYSTLKRPQVETKVDIAYEYKLLDFTVAAEGESSAVKLMSLRDLPHHLQELYQKGFVLAGFHPFIYPVNGQKTNPLEKMFRAILIKTVVSSEENSAKTEPGSLEVDLCLLANQPVNSKGLEDILQKVQEKSKKDSRFVGHVLYQNSTANSMERSEEVSAANSILNQNKAEKDEQSDNNGDKLASSQDSKGPPGEGSQSEAQAIECQEKADDQPTLKITSQTYQEDESQIQDKSLAGSEVDDIVTDKQDASSPAEASGLEAADGLHTVGTAVGEQSPTATNEFTEGKPITECRGANDRKQEVRSKQGLAEGIRQRNVVENEIFLLFNKQQVSQNSRKYYTATIPLKVSKKGEDINSLEADWLEHMTEHFTKGALLVDALICLGTLTDSIPKSVDGLFIFEGGSDEKYEPYDAIVVEQWTVINGNEVKADYVPLLNSLAAYGWQLTCVLPTPIVRRDSDGNLATKQIVFLQRPSLPSKEKKKEPKKKSTKDEKSSKKDKSCLKDKNGKAPLTVKKSKEVSDEKLEESMAKNGDKENVETGISLKTERNENSVSGTEGVQNYICVTNAEAAGSAGLNTVPKNVMNKAHDDENICENEGMKIVQEKHENECQNDTISQSEGEACQAKVNTPVNSECTVTSQHLNNMPAQALEEATGSI